MRFSASTLLFVLVASTAAQRGKGGGRGGQNGNNDNNNDGQNDDEATAADEVTSTGATVEATGQAQGNIANAQALQTSLQLDASQVMTNIQLDGNQVPADGQAASITSINNFINHCAQFDLPLTNGQQVKTGSCNPVPMGVIIAADKMPSCKFTFPVNFGEISANTDFDIKLKIQNFQAGIFVNAQSNYFGGPQAVDANGLVIGHSHVVIEALAGGFQQNTPNDPTVFSFFKGINTPADGNGELTATVTDGLPAGTYKLSTINSAANHQPYLVSIAQHASLDDTIYFTVVDGQASTTGQTAAADDATTDSTAVAATTTDSTSADAATSGVATTDSSTATDEAASTGNGNAGNAAGGNNNGQGRRGRGNGRGGGNNAVVSSTLPSTAVTVSSTTASLVTSATAPNSAVDASAVEPSATTGNGGSTGNGNAQTEGSGRGGGRGGRNSAQRGAQRRGRRAYHGA